MKKAARKRYGTDGRYGLIGWILERENKAGFDLLCNSEAHWDDGDDDLTRIVYKELRGRSTESVAVARDARRLVCWSACLMLFAPLMPRDRVKRALLAILGVFRAENLPCLLEVDDAE